MASLRDILLTAVAPIIWGTTYIVTTQFLPPNRPFTVAALRALPVGLILLALFRKLPQGVWQWRAIVLGALNIGLFFGLLFVGVYRLPGGVAAVVGAIQPLIVAFLAWSWAGEKLRLLTIIAAIIGLSGVTLIVLTPAAQLDAVGLIAVFTATILMACGTVLAKRWGKPPVSLLIFTSWQLVVGGLILVPVTLFIEGLPPELTITNILGFTYLGIIGTGLAYTLWFRGIGKLNASTVTFLALFSPVVALLIDVIFLQKSLTITQIIGVAMVLTGIVIAQQKQAGATENKIEIAKELSEAKQRRNIIG